MHESERERVQRRQIDDHAKNILQNPLSKHPTGKAVRDRLQTLPVDSAAHAIELAEAAGGDPALVQRFRNGLFKSERWGILRLTLALGMCEDRATPEQMVAKVHEALTFVDQTFPLTPTSEDRVFGFDCRALHEDGTTDMLLGQCTKHILTHLHDWRRILRGSTPREMAHELLAMFLAQKLGNLGLVGRCGPPMRPTPEADSDRYLAPIVSTHLRYFLLEGRKGEAVRTQPHVDAKASSALEELECAPGQDATLIEFIGHCLSLGRQEDIPLLMSKHLCGVSVRHLAVISGREDNAVTKQLTRAWQRMHSEAASIDDPDLLDDVIRWLDRLFAPRSIRAKARLSTGETHQVFRVISNRSGNLALTEGSGRVTHCSIGFGSPEEGMDGIVGSVSFAADTFSPPLMGSHDVLAAIGPSRSPLVIRATLAGDDESLTARFHQVLPIQPDIGLYSPDQVRFYIAPTEVDYSVDESTSVDA